MLTTVELLRSLVPTPRRAIVFDVAASTGGAMTVLEDFYHEAVGQSWSKTVIYLVHSTGEFAATETVKTLKYEWLKRSWFHRLAFDYLVAPVLIRRVRADVVVSLQNVGVPFTPTNAIKILKVHNPLPFTDLKFKLREDALLWVYQNAVARLIIRSIQKSDQVLVQTEWMRRSVISSALGSEDRVSIVETRRPSIPTISRTFRPAVCTFVYPASDVSYKNHRLVLAAAQILQQAGLRDFRIVFTIEAGESRRARKLSEQSLEFTLPVDFVGHVDRKVLLSVMAGSVMVFPSLLETLGLPLLEAAELGIPIVAANLPYAREVLHDYARVAYFDPLDAESLAHEMQVQLAQWQVGG